MTYRITLLAEYTKPEELKEGIEIDRHREVKN